MLSEVFRSHRRKRPSARYEILHKALDVDRFNETDCTTENGHEISNLGFEKSVTAKVAPKHSAA